MSVKYVSPNNLAEEWVRIKAGFAAIVHNHNAATTATAGFMSPEDKKQLNSFTAFAAMTNEDLEGILK